MLFKECKELFQGKTKTFEGKRVFYMSPDDLLKIGMVYVFILRQKVK